MSDRSRSHGRFLCLDGPDGGGKTTQVARLVEWLRSMGQTVVACRDPGGTALGDRLRSIFYPLEPPHKGTNTVNPLRRSLS